MSKFALLNCIGWIAIVVMYVVCSTIVFAEQYPISEPSAYPSPQHSPSPTPYSSASTIHQIFPTPTLDISSSHTSGVIKSVSHVSRVSAKIQTTAKKIVDLRTMMSVMSGKLFGSDETQHSGSTAKTISAKSNNAMSIEPMGLTEDSCTYTDRGLTAYAKISFDDQAFSRIPYNYTWDPTYDIWWMPNGSIFPFSCSGDGLVKKYWTIGRNNFYCDIYGCDGFEGDVNFTIDMKGFTMGCYSMVSKDDFHVFCAKYYWFLIPYEFRIKCNESWTEKPYCKGNKVYQKYQAWNCTTIEKLKQTCSAGCSRGLCLSPSPTPSPSPPFCIGVSRINLNISVQNTTITQSGRLKDYCLNGTTVRKYYCQSSSRKSIDLSCDYGCAKGVCLAKP